MTLLKLIQSSASVLLLSGLVISCASVQSADQLADYNGDGLVSDAEYKQYMKQKTWKTVLSILKAPTVAT